MVSIDTGAIADYFASRYISLAKISKKNELYNNSSLFLVQLIHFVAVVLSNNKCNFVQS